VVDVWVTFQPILSTNRAFLDCRSDRGGPFNQVWLAFNGLSTNVVPSSYYYLPGFFNSDPPGSSLAQRRRVEVTHPSQKAMVVCCALPSGNNWALLQQMGQTGANVWPQVHGPFAFTVAFVDGHAAYQKWNKWYYDGQGLYDDWSRLSWIDFP